MFVKPEEVGLSSERLKRLSNLLDGYVAQARYAGVSMLVGRRGGVAYAHAAGVQDLESGVAIADDTIFRIYSMTKPIAVVAALMLYEEGKFLLEDPIARYLPEFSPAQVLIGGDADNPETRPATREITIRDLMCHTSGLTYDFTGAGVVSELYQRGGISSQGNYDLAEFVRRLGAMPLLCDPGREWNYGVSTDVIGRLVEVLSGRTLARYFSESIFAPLGMTDTAFHVPADKLGRFATCYKLDEGRAMTPNDPADGHFARAPKLFSGGGGLTSTLWDYQRFVAMLANKGELAGQRLLGRKTVEFMATNHLPGDMAQLGQPIHSGASCEGIGFGLGVAVMLDPAKNQVMSSPGEFCWNGMASTAFWVDPAERLYAVFMTQLMPASSYQTRRELRTLVYQALID